jgi:alpha-mannosidase
MKTESSVKLIKKEERKGPEPHAAVKRAVDPNRWSTAVKSWVSEFQKHRRGESLPAFDSLFK